MTTMDETWRRIHDAAEPMFALGAYVDGKLLGIVQYLFHRSFWTTGDYCYLQDLFVAKETRGLGLGRALIEAVYERAKSAWRKPRALADAGRQRHRAALVRQHRRPPGVYSVSEGFLISLRLKRK
jgi:GNAT superfamily N-acetyltransferase